MNTAHTPSPSSGQLAPGALLSLRAARAGLQLQVSQGRVWATLQGAPDDHFIAAGQTLALPRGARLLLQGDSAEPAVWALTAAQASPPLVSTATPVADNRRHEPVRTAPAHTLRPQLR